MGRKELESAREKLGIKRFLRTMPDGDLPRVFRTLTQAAARFEQVAAKHHRIEAERKSLQEALTDAQLVLSLQHRRLLAEVRKLKVPSDARSLRS